MTAVSRSSSTTRRWGGLALLAVGFAFAAQLISGWMSPSHAVDTFCLPSDTTACIAGTLRVNNDATVFPDVTVTVTGPDGVAHTTETSETGRWNVSVTVPGAYTVVVSPDDLPDGINSKGEVTVQATLGKTAAAIIEVREAGYKESSSRWDYFWQSAANGLRFGLVLALASVGLSLIYGTTGLSNFAHAEQVTLGGVLAYGLVNVAGMNLFIGGALTVVLCAASGFLQDRFMWRQLRRRGLGLTQMMIVTIGLSLALQYTYVYFIGAGKVRISTATPTSVQLGPVSMSHQSLFAMGISVAVLSAVGYVLLKTRIGQATRAVSDNPALAAASGIDVDRVILIVWTAACGLAGLSGIMAGLVDNGVNYDSGLQLLLLLFAAVTLGGLGTAFGALVGSLIIGMVVELTPFFHVPGDLKYASALLILILLLLVRPQGILGRAERVG